MGRYGDGDITLVEAREHCVEAKKAISRGLSPMAPLLIENHVEFARRESPAFTSCTLSSHGSKPTLPA
jgi:hypothetical protein